MMSDFKSLVSKYIKSIEDTRKYGGKICTELKNNLREVIPDIYCTLGWAEAGIDMLCLWSDSRDVSKRGLRGLVKLSNVIEDEIPELKGHIDAPYGVYLTKDEAERIRQILRRLRGD